MLEPIFPGEFTSNPLDAVVDLLEEQGLPFEELAESGSDDQIEWNADEAEFGTDKPDKEFQGNKRTIGRGTAQFPRVN